MQLCYHRAKLISVMSFLVVAGWFFVFGPTMLFTGLKDKGRPWSVCNMVITSIDVPAQIKPEDLPPSPHIKSTTVLEVSGVAYLLQELPDVSYIEEDLL